MEEWDDEWEEEYLTFKLDELHVGFLYIKVRFRETSLFLCFDENLADGVPGMVQMYNELKEGRPYDFFELYDDCVIFETSNIRNGTVLFTVRCTNGNDVWEIKLSSYMPIEVLLHVFEKFFDDLLHHPDFPYQYPCHGDFDSDLYVKAGKIADEYIKAHHIVDEDEIIEIEKKFDRENLTMFTENGEYLYQCFKDMLINRRVPNGWKIRRMHPSASNEFY